MALRLQFWLSFLSALTIILSQRSHLRVQKKGRHMIWGKTVLLITLLLWLSGCLAILSSPGRTGSPSSAPYHPEVEKERREQPTPSLFRFDVELDPP